MPSDVPAGVGFLGALKYAAIRRVIEEREKTLHALLRHEEAEAAALDAHARKEVAKERLRSLDLIQAEAREGVRQKYEETVELGELAKLKRRLERVELEGQIAQAERTLAKAKIAPDAKDVEEEAGEVDEFLDALGRFPDLMAEVNRVKEGVRAAAPNGVLGDAEQQMMDTLDAMLAAWAAKRAEQMTR